ncbi:MAG: carbohydrate deacetylase [Phycisphaerae bacterium]
MIKQLIINADDFGFSRSVTDGILYAHSAGILTSTTLMTTMPDCDRALDLVQSHPTLGVGIHLSLTQGTPRYGRMKYLVSADGQFPRQVRPLLQRLSLYRKARAEAKAEWAAQIEYALRRHLQPTHLDSHKHIHHWPALAEIAMDLAGEYHIHYLRCADEMNLVGAPGLSPGYRALRFLARRLKRRVTGSSLRTTDWFYGLAATGQFSSQTWLQLLALLPAGIGEVMVHPGYADDLDASRTRLTTQRRCELDALCDPAVVKQAGAVEIQRVHFGQI